jgi:hypothetical protein
MSRVVQQRQVFLGLPTLVEALSEAVVGQAESRRREEVVAVGVVRERSRLTHQRVDDVPVMHRVLVPPDQSRSRVGELVRVPDLDTVRVQPGLHPLADQTAVDRVNAAVDVNQGSGIHTATHLEATRLTLLGQLRQGRDLLGEAITPTPVANHHQLSEEVRVFLPAREVTAAAHKQRLINGGLEVPVRRFGIAVLVRLPCVDPLTRQTVVIQEIAVTRLILSRCRVVVHRRRETVAAVLPRHATEFPQCLLQPFRERFKRLRHTQIHRFPIRVGQNEVVDEMIERVTADRHQ